MNSLERVTLALNHKEPDRVPVYPLINSVSMQTMGINYEEWSKDPKKCAECIIKTTDEIGVDVMCTLVDLSVEAADWGQKVVYSPVNAAHPDMDDRLIKTADDYDIIEVINPRETPRMSEHIELARLLYEARGQEKPLVGFIFGPLGVLSMMRGQEQMFYDMIKCPEKMNKALENITETLKQFAIALIEAGCHAIMFDTLYSSKTILSPKMWDKVEGPLVEELANTVREHGAMVMVHNCGEGLYMKEQIKRMQPIAFSLDHFPPDCSTMEEMKEKYGDQTTFIGMIEPGWLLAATEEQVREECRRQIDACKKDGGFILATGCEYPSALNFDMAKVMVEEADTYGRYDK
ncbi:MAG: uroporphyrinogen decarboxylase family protein [Eubacteriales bacterium]|jgi:uroporphyrinogen decarboxylase|nr:uroporphyrinogen decarboxylase family protein [Eubacteriales bacterium]